MASWDVKKFISVFLVLAVSISGLTLLFANLPAGSGQTTLAPRQPLTASLPLNAFSNSPGFVVNNQSPAGAPSGNKNLTDDLSQALAQSLMDANPSGPQAASGTGSATLAAPDAAALNQNLVQTLADANLVDTPNFEENAPDSELKIVADSKENKTSYAIAVSNVLSGTILGADFTNVLGETPDADTVASAQSILAQAESSVRGTAVPSSLVPFHKSLLTLLINRKKFADIAAGTEGDDPLKSLIVLQKTAGQIDAVINRDNQSFISELKKAGFQTISENGGSGEELLAKIFNSLFSIEKAEAFVFVPTGDVLNKPDHIATSIATHASWIRQIWEWAQVVLLQLLQNTLVRLMQQRIVGWVQGAGAPRFITNWAGSLVKSFNLGSSFAIQSQVVPNLCSAFGPQIITQLNSSFGTTLPPSLGSGGNCPIQQVIPSGNLNDFYSDFNQGGWAAYGMSLLPSNNYYGSLFAASQAAAAAGQSSQNAAQAKAVASQGFNGTGPGGSSAQCTSPIPESESYGKTETQTDAVNHLTNMMNDQVQGGAVVIQQITCSDTTCSYSVCNPDNYHENITTPGVTIAHQLDQALGSQFQHVTGAKNIIGLVAAVIDSAMNDLIRMGESGIVSAFQSSPPSTGGATLGSSLCGGLSGTALVNCQNQASTANQTVSQASAPPPAETVPSTSTPAVVITSPAASSTVSGTVTLAASAPNTGVSTSRVLSIQFLVDGGPVGDVLYSTPYRTSWDTTTVENGTHQISALITNVSNATGTTGLTTVTVSNISVASSTSSCAGLSGAALTACLSSAP